MIGPRLNRWLARHAAANVAALAVPCTPATAAAVAGVLDILFFDSPDPRPSLLCVLVGIAALLGTIAWARYIGCVMGRAGLSTQDTLWRAAAGAILLAVAAATVGAGETLWN